MTDAHSAQQVHKTGAVTLNVLITGINIYRSHFYNIVFYTDSYAFLVRMLHFAVRKIEGMNLIDHSQLNLVHVGIQFVDEFGLQLV